MELLHVVSIHAGKFFDKTWKIQAASIEKSYRTSLQHRKLSWKKTNCFREIGNFTTIILWPIRESEQPFSYREHICNQSDPNTTFKHTLLGIWYFLEILNFSNSLFLGSRLVNWIHFFFRQNYNELTKIWSKIPAKPYFYILMENCPRWKFLEVIIKKSMKCISYSHKSTSDCIL